MEEVMVSEEYKIAVTEVLEILNYLPQNMVSNIPTKLILFFKEHSLPDNKSKFDYSKGLDKIPLTNKTKSLLAMIYRDYICSEEERIEYDNVLYQNEQIYQERLKEKYAIEIFRQKEEESKKDQLIVYKQQRWYERIFKKILKIFNK